MIPNMRNRKDADRKTAAELWRVQMSAWEVQLLHVQTSAWEAQLLHVPMSAWEA